MNNDRTTKEKKRNGSLTKDKITKRKEKKLTRSSENFDFFKK